MRHVEKVPCQGYFARRGNTVKLEDRNGAKKAIKYNIADFFICNVYCHNGIYSNYQKSCSIKRLFLTPIHIIFYLSNIFITVDFSFHYRKLNHPKIHKINFSLDQAFAIFKFQHFLQQKKLKGLNIFLRVVDLIMLKLVNFCIKRLHKKNSYGDVHSFYIIILILCIRWGFELSISVNFDF